MGPSVCVQVVCEDGCAVCQVGWLCVCVGGVCVGKTLYDDVGKYKVWVAVSPSSACVCGWCQCVCIRHQHMVCKPEKCVAFTERVWVVVCVGGVCVGGVCVGWCVCAGWCPQCGWCKPCVWVGVAPTGWCVSWVVLTVLTVVCVWVVCVVKWVVVMCPHG